MRILDPGPLFSIPRIQAEARTINLEIIGDGSGAARGNDTREGWINGLRMTRLYGLDYGDRLSEYPAIDQLVRHQSIRLMQDIHQVMVNEIAAGKALEVHRDGPPKYDRWHFPIVTNALVEWWDEREGIVHMECGKWHGPVNYCGILHSMHNGGSEPRMHLVVDFIP